MDAVVDYERLDVHEGLAAAAASFVSMMLALLLVLIGWSGIAFHGPTWADVGAWLGISLIYAGPIWLAGFLLIGLPIAMWIERRTSVDASWSRRFGPYAVAALLTGGLLYLVYPIFLPATVGAALGGKVGVELWRRWDRRNRTTPWPPAV